MALQTLPNVKLNAVWVEIAPGATEVLVQCTSAASAVIAVSADAPGPGDVRGHHISGAGSLPSTLTFADLAGAKVYARASSSSAELAVTSRT